MNKGLTWFANLWLGLAAVVNGLLVVQAFASTNSLWAGIGQIRQVYDPFDLQNTLFQIVLFAPVGVALVWRNHRQERPTR